MQVGFASIQEADQFLDLEMNSDAWFDQDPPTPLAGTVESPAVPDNTVIGTGTDFVSDLAVGDYVEADYQFSRVQSITNVTLVVLEDNISIEGQSEIYNHSPDEWQSRKDLARKKIRALTTAYRRIVEQCDFSDFTEVNGVPQVTDAIKQASYLLALTIIQEPSPSRHDINHAAGVKREKIGDAEVEYLGGSAQEFSPRIKRLLGSYLSTGEPVRMTRRPMNLGNVDEITSALPVDPLDVL